MKDATAISQVSIITKGGGGGAGGAMSSGCDVNDGADRYERAGGRDDARGAEGCCARRRAGGAGIDAGAPLTSSAPGGRRVRPGSGWGRF